jgi:hypothetical protein
MTGGPHA